VSTLREDLALEEWALGELLDDAERLWRNGNYKAALQARSDAEWARERIAALQRDA